VRTRCVSHDCRGRALTDHGGRDHVATKQVEVVRCCSTHASKAIGCVMPDKAALAEAFDISEIFLEPHQIFLNIIPAHILLRILMSKHDKV
jgi:hypothetical protein